MNGPKHDPELPARAPAASWADDPGARIPGQDAAPRDTAELARAATLAARWCPPASTTGGEVCQPAILIAGQAVHAWIQDGVLCVDVEIGAPDPGALGPDAGDLVPICFSVGGEPAVMLGQPAPASRQEPAHTSPTQAGDTR